MATEEPMNLVLEHLRHIRKVQGTMAEDLHLMGLRIGSMERMMSGTVMTEIQQNEQLDMLKARVERIERRLDLVD
jgi:hypothetical protein